MGRSRYFEACSDDTIMQTRLTMALPTSLIPFDPLKVTQAAAVLAKLEAGQRISRLRLLKLLYIADREHLAEHGRPITGDRAAALDHGPVLTITYDLIKGTDSGSTIWSRHFTNVGRDVLLNEDPGVGKLSKREIERLQSVSKRFLDDSDWDVAEFTHRFPEWQKNQPQKNSSKSIPLSDLLEALGMTGEMQHLLEVAHVEHAADQFFGS